MNYEDGVKKILEEEGISVREEDFKKLVKDFRATVKRGEEISAKHAEKYRELAYNTARSFLIREARSGGGMIETASNTEDGEE